MKIVNIIGGLGNQMFQYAFYLSLKDKFPNEDIYVDVHHFQKYGLHNGFELSNIFKLKDCAIASKRQIKRISRYIPNYKLSRIARKLLPLRKTEFIENKEYVFDKNPYLTNSDCYYEGYWQSPEYFDSIKRIVIKNFEFKDIDIENQMLFNKIKSQESICIHVRRGDYVNAVNFSNICTLQYYKKAIDLLQQKYSEPYFYIFSNDIDWCKENFKTFFTNNSNIIFVIHNKGTQSFKDMYLMSGCKNMILANSSFSWWAAYLNIHDDSQIIAPKKWVNQNYETNIHLDKWIKI